jgi:hypothetical protein
MRPSEQHKAQTKERLQGRVPEFTQMDADAGHIGMPSEAKDVSSTHMEGADFD